MTTHATLFFFLSFSLPIVIRLALPLASYTG
jgi:hypothetical protein